MLDAIEHSTGFSLPLWKDADLKSSVYGRCQPSASVLDNEGQENSSR